MRTTDPQDELLPIVDRKDHPIGQIKRKEAHLRPDIIHRAISVLIFDESGQLLIQKRSMTKDTCPGFWSESVGGHVGVNEGYQEVAVREVYEELGVQIHQSHLTKVGKIITLSEWEQEMTMVFCFSIPSTTPLKPNKEEISEITYIDKRALKKSIITEKWTPSSLQILQAFVLK